MAKRRCICAFEACAEEGSEASVVLAEKYSGQDEWLRLLGVDASTYNKKDGRLSLCHFAQSQIKAENANVVADRPPRVKPIKGALPTQSNEDIRNAAGRGALGDSLKWQARAQSYKEAATTAKANLHELQLEQQTLHARVNYLEEELRKARKEIAPKSVPGGGGEKPSMDYTRLVGMDSTAARSLCGLPNSACLEVCSHFMQLARGY